MDGEAIRNSQAFAGRAEIYARYRRGYPPHLITRLQRFAVGQENRALDLGCGTGQLSLQMAPFFGEVVGLDPEPDMLREAERAARRGGVSNVRWLLGSTLELERLRSTIGLFELATIGTAFHFMDPSATLSTLRQMAGAVAVVYAGSPMWLHPRPWAMALRRVLTLRLGPLEERDFTDEALRACEEWMRELGYVQIERWEHSYEERVDIDFVVGHILSATSEAQIPLTDRDELEHEVRSAIEAVTHSRTVSEPVRIRAVIAATGRRRH